MGQTHSGQSGHFGLPFGVGRHLEPIVVQTGDQAHNRVVDPQGPGSLGLRRAYSRCSGSAGTRTLRMWLVSLRSPPTTEELTTWSGTVSLSDWRL